MKSKLSDKSELTTTLQSQDSKIKAVRKTLVFANSLDIIT